MMQAIYSIKAKLLENQLSFLSNEEKDQIGVIAEFAALCHTPWFLKCFVSSTAQSLQFQSVMQMMRYEKHQPDIAQLVQGSMKNHLWHLTVQSVVVALTDEDLSAVERKALTAALFSTKRPATFETIAQKFPDVFDKKFHPKRLWLSGQVPQLSRFVGPQSWLIFSKLNLKEEDCEWMQLDPESWPLFSGYAKFKEFVKNTVIVNDPAERGLDLATGFRESFNNERDYQNNLLGVAESRKEE